MADYESLRLANIQRNKALLQELELDKSIIPNVAATAPSSSSSSKRRRIDSTPTTATRSSSRIASQEVCQTYTEEPDTVSSSRPKTRRTKSSSAKPSISRSTSIATDDLESNDISEGSDIDYPSRWTWTPAAPLPTRLEDGILHFDSHPQFQPNKTPSEILHEGAFGGTYFRPYHSRKLNITVTDDYQDLPADWFTGLDADKYLTSEKYRPEVNKYGVKCGQTIEEWEAQGWINLDYDIRGWFQWYCRFYAGRRCPDDDRQVKRWDRCCGDRGRWRRALLKKYVSEGIRSVGDEDGDGGGGGEVSPVVHQTCHHWVGSASEWLL